MQKMNFNTGWHYTRDSGVMGEKITLPHDAMLAEPRSADCPGGTNTGWFEGHDYTYEKTFFASLEWSDKKIVLEFEGVYHNAEVFLNGEKIAFHAYGYTGFYVDIGQCLQIGKENTLRVIARNANQPNSRWYSGAGIYRTVWLYVLPEKHVALNGIKIKTLSCCTPEIQVEISTVGTGPVKVEILDNDTILSERTVESDGTASTAVSLPGAQLWAPESPRLYTCRATFGEDVREERFGIRLVDCDSKKGFCINGKRIILRGACIHHDNGLLGAVAHPFAEERKIRLLMEAGYNAIRSAHNPCSKALLDACDRLGMLVMDEYADMWYIHKTRYDYATDLAKNWREDLRDIVDKDYNHPSVVMYSIGNEVSETAQLQGIALCGEMTEYLHRLDNRPVTCGINIFFNFLSSKGFGVYSDKKAAKGGEKKKAVGSEFFNNLAGLFGSGFMKFGATLHGSDVKTQEAFSKLDVAGYNYGEKRYEKDLKKYPDRVIVGSETFCVDAARFWDLAQKHPAIIGDFVWAGIDYLGEVGIGAMEYKDYAPDFDHGPGWIAAGVGVLDLTGAFTGQTAYIQVAFARAPIRISVVPVNHTFERHSPSAWRMSNAIESWAWNGCEGKETRIEIYARGAKVALYLNGKSLGEYRPDRDCRVSCRAVWQPGELTAISYDAMGKELGRTSLYSAGEETKLMVFPENDTVDKDGLCYIRLHYTDDHGMRKPLARGDIKVTVEGGELLSLGSACPYNARGYLADTTDTYYGEALAIVKPEGPSKVRLHAESPYGEATGEIICRGWGGEYA